MEDPHKFFFEITPAIKLASRRNQDAARKLATQFNIFDYLRTDEIGLSKLFKDFLDPSGKHGQGTMFLNAFFELIPIDNRPHIINPDQVRIRTEYTIDSGRRIDIYVEIQCDGQKFILAIENKPYAADSENQVRDYLEFLEKKSERFRLVYLSPDGDGPSISSIPNHDRERWKEKLVLMSYANVNDGDEVSDNIENECSSFDVEPFFHRCDASLADWFKICKERCEVDKLRWILSDAESYCVKEFQGMKTSTDEEVLAVEEFLLNHRHYIETAQKVHDSWRSVVNKIATEFFDLLNERIEKQIKNEFARIEDLRLEPVYEFNGGYSFLSLFRSSWHTQEDSSLPAQGRCRIVLGDDIKVRPDWWFVGVITPYQSDELAEQLLAEIPDCIMTNPNWPAYKYMDSDYRDWESILPRLIEELESAKSEISDYYVERFLEFTRKALPILDDSKFGVG